MRYMSFCVCLLSLIICLEGSSILYHISVSLLFMAKCSTEHFICSSVFGHLGASYLELLLNNASMNICVQVFQLTCFHFH